MSDRLQGRGGESREARRAPVLRAQTLVPPPGTRRQGPVGAGTHTHGASARASMCLHGTSHRLGLHVHVCVRTWHRDGLCLLFMGQVHGELGWPSSSRNTGPQSHVEVPALTRDAPRAGGWPGDD